MRAATTAVLALCATATHAGVVAVSKPDLDRSGSHYFVTLTAENDPDRSDDLIFACLNTGKSREGSFLTSFRGKEDMEAFQYQIDDTPAKSGHFLIWKYDSDSRFFHDLALAQRLTLTPAGESPIAYRLEGIYEAVANITRNCDVD